MPIVEVIIPATRPSVDDLIASLHFQTIQADSITVVSNEITPLEGVKLIRFWSDLHPIGRGDAGLRRNIGADDTDADIILFLDDDLVAPVGLIKAMLPIVERDGFCWGHHRYIDFSQIPAGAMIHMEPERGRSREAYVNDWHGWQSSYAGLLGIRRDLFWEVGGFDLGFLGYHGSEDQHLGRRLSKGSNRTFVHEPPFAWHPEEDLYHSEPVTNVEGSHQLRTVTVNGQSFATCETCPYRRPSDPGALVLSDQVAIPYSRSDFRIEKEWT